MARIRFGIIITALAVIGLSIPPAGQAAEPQATKGPEEVAFATSPPRTARHAGRELREPPAGPR